MADEEKDPERFQRVMGIVTKMREATEGHTVGDAQMAFANAIGQMCLTALPEDPDHVFLNTMASLTEVWLSMREAKKQAGVLPGVVN